MAKTVPRRIFNRMLHLMARFLPGSTSLRPFLHRLRGVKIHGKVFIGDDVYLENEYPECVEIHDGGAILLRSTIIAHFEGQPRTQLDGQGKIVIEKNAIVMSGCMIVCSPGQSLTIGEGSVISAGSVVQSNIPPYTLCAGPRVKAMANVTVPFTFDTSYQDFMRGLTPLRSTSNKVDQ